MDSGEAATLERKVQDDIDRVQKQLSDQDTSLKQLLESIKNATAALEKLLQIRAKVQQDGDLAKYVDRLLSIPNGNGSVTQGAGNRTQQAGDGEGEGDYFFTYKAETIVNNSATPVSKFQVAEIALAQGHDFGDVDPIEASGRTLRRLAQQKRVRLARRGTGQRPNLYARSRRKSEELT